MNTFVSSLYDWSCTSIVDPEENDGEDTDDEDFVRISSSSSECGDVIVLD